MVPTIGTMCSLICCSQWYLPTYEGRGSEAWRTIEAYSHVLGAMVQYCNRFLNDPPNGRRMDEFVMSYGLFQQNDVYCIAQGGNQYIERCHYVFFSCCVSLQLSYSHNHRLWSSLLDLNLADTYIYSYRYFIIIYDSVPPIEWQKEWKRNLKCNLNTAHLCAFTSIGLASLSTIGWVILQCNSLE